MTNGWIGVDLDVTLAYFDHWRGALHIGEPFPLLLERVIRWLDQGQVVRIFTERVYREGIACVVLHLRDGRTTTIPVAALAADREEFVRDLQAHLQRGHGLRPL